MKNTEVAGSEIGGPCWSSSAVLIILASNTEVYLPSQHNESRLGYNIPRYAVYTIHSYTNGSHRGNDCLPCGATPSRAE